MFGAPHIFWVWQTVPTDLRSVAAARKGVVTALAKATVFWLVNYAGWCAFLLVYQT
jgi:hypothetical protein